MTDASRMLSALGSGVWPVDVGARSPTKPIEAWDFGALLEAVRNGRLPSGRQLRLVGAKNDALDASQCRRLAQAADAAEAAGMDRIGAIIDGLAVDLDVVDRSVGRVLRLTPSAGDAPLLRAPLDGLAVVPEEASRPWGLCPCAGMTLAPDVLRVIGRMTDPGEGAAAQRS